MDDAYMKPGMHPVTNGRPYTLLPYTPRHYIEEIDGYANRHHMEVVTSFLKVILEKVSVCAPMEVLQKGVCVCALGVCAARVCALRPLPRACAP